jgi:hypothetical protein
VYRHRSTRHSLNLIQSGTLTEAVHEGSVFARELGFSLRDVSLSRRSARIGAGSVTESFPLLAALYDVTVLPTGLAWKIQQRSSS